MQKRIWTFTLHVLALTLASSLAAAEPAAPTPAQAARADIEKTLGFVPAFFKAMPDAALPGTWQEMKELQLNPGSALPGRLKELIGLAVSAQVPCRYCTYAHTEFAKLNGASAAELGEAVAIAGVERHFSAYFYGLSLDEAAFRGELARMVANAKKPAAAAAPIAVVDAKSALLDIEKTLGFVPEFFKKLPATALPGAWREFKDMKLGAQTVLPAKSKALISLAVASQVPSRVCIVAETEFAKLAGATDVEIAEAVGMAAVTRNMSTLLNGQQTDERGFRADIDRLVAGVKSAQRKAALAERGTHAQPRP
jgi:AhpD family alkylhydroperoxidase